MNIEDFEGIAATLAHATVNVGFDGTFTSQEKFPARRGIVEAVSLFSAQFVNAFPDAPHTFTNMFNNARANYMNYGIPIVCFHEDIMDLEGGPKCNKCGIWTDRIKPLIPKGEQFPFVK